jgi:hypothetical protein
MSLNSISGQFRNTILNLNLQSPPDIVTGLVNLTNSVTVSAYLDSLGQDAVVNNFSVQNPGDVDTAAIPTRAANLNRTLNTPTDINAGINNLTANQQYVASFIGGRGAITTINDFANTNPGDVLTEAINPRILDLGKNLNTPADITAGVNDLTPNAQFAAQYLSGRGAFSVINDFNVVNPGDVLTDAIAPRNLDLAKNLNTPTDITAGVNDLTPNAQFAAQYLSGRGSFSVINDFNVTNPGDVLTDAIAPRNLDFSRNLNTPTDITAGVNDLTPNAALAAQYLSGRGSFSVINDFVVANPGDVLTDAVSPRNLNFAQTLNTPTDITAGVQNLTPNSTLAAQYLSGRGAFAPINTTPNINPGDVITDAVAPRNLNFNRTLNTPTDITAGVNNLSGAFAAQYLSGRGAFSVINDYINVNPGNVQTDAVAPRNLNFNRTLNTPIDITAGLNNLSGSFAAQYLAGRGLDTVINDFANLNPGNVVVQSLAPRLLNLNRNLNTPTDITAGLLNLSGSFAAQYLAGRGTNTIINDFQVINPGDVSTQALAPRALNLSMTLNTPIDITSGISTLTPNASLAAQYLSGRGLDTIINTYANVNPGNVTTIANPLRISLFNRNIIKDPQNDATDQFTTANPGTVAIGADTIINDYTVLNQNELIPFGQPWADSNIRNRYQAELAELVSGTSDLFLNNDPNTPQNPYLTEDKLNNADPTQLVLGDFLNLPTASTPLSALLGADLNVANLITGPGLKNDTLLAQIGALELKFHLEARIAAKLAQEALGLTTIDDMVTNPLKIIEAIKNPSSILERGDADITTFKGALGKVASFLSDVGGLGGLTSAFFEDDSVVLRPTCFSDSEYSTYDIDKKLDERDISRIEETGRGQRFPMFLNLGINKYTPEFVSKLDRSNKRLLEGLAKSQTGNETIAFKTYISGGKNGIFYLLQDKNGLQVKTNAELTRAITFDPITNRENAFSEPGVENVSKYSSIQTSFVWRGTTRETFLDFENQQTSLDNWDTRIKDVDTLSKTKAFRDCSILDVTQTLLESGIENRAIRAIDQTKTKFTDGYNFSPKGSGVITPYRQERRNKKDELTGYRYLVPGLDAAGNRDDERMYNEVELCRTWTKAKPFTKITDLIRWKELHRKERNSVLDRYGNLNIHPSPLNVNEGYGRLGDGLGDAVVEAFGEKRARKYMFSIENLAWRESRLFTDLPACEKGANGGRIMWFPPYNIRFTDDTTTNWTAHQFLGRPEPIYTYNNTERSGTLSWDIVVDHPTILNLLVSKEFASLTDGEVDELLAAFWAGCLEYDVFELARIWGVFSESDIEYFQKVIEDLDIRLPNEVIRSKVRSSGVNNDKRVEIETDDEEAPSIPQFNLFFENDIPLPKKSYKVKPFTVEPYDVYFQTYTDLANGINIDKNSEYQEEEVYGSTKASNLANKQWIRYDKTIGKQMPPESNYFFAKDRTAYPAKNYGYEQQVEALKTSDYSAEKYSLTKNHNLTIEMVAHASPSAPGRTIQEIEKYNNKLASRRFVSVVKWFIPKVLSNDTIKCYNVSDGLEITPDNINNIFVNGLEDTNTITILRGDVNEPTKRQTIVLNVTAAVGLTNDDVFPTDPPSTPTQIEYKDLFGAPKIFKVDGEDIQYYEIPYQNKIYYMVKTYNEYDKVAGKFKPNGTLVSNDLIGTSIAIRVLSNGAEVKQIYRREADVICGNLSSQASYARRVEINSVLAPKEIPIIRTIPPNPDPPREIEERFVSTNITKREIAQRILNKLLTECDYFEYLSQEAPIVYDSLKSKLKYFTPAFHSMTPEGLNTRLTFLQQCMRPGETITKNQGEGNCDAKNTAFGKPPVCVLRIGDFYHTKIVINNLNISYDPLVWDLNPEGIGVQPMLAKVNLSFKYIGGQGLRRYVDQLQNALSFNYYANADVYDERTFANTDRRERDLINLEQDFFAQNTLDLIPIVAQARLITPTTEFLPVPVGTIGIISQRLLPKLAGGTYYNYLVSATPFSPTTDYPAEACVIYQGQYYVRKVTKYPASGPTLPTDTNTWSIVDHSNFGEFAFRQEYGRYYISQYDIQYDGMFGELYKTFGEYIYALTGEKENVSDANERYRTLTDILRKKNYSKSLPTTGTTISDIISSISGNTIPLGSFSGLTFYETFRNISDDKRYTELGDIFKNHPLFLSKNNNKPEQFEALKLNLHPQEYMFKVGDGLGLPYNFTGLTGATNNGRSTKYFQGSFTNGYTNFFDGVSETGGIFFKEVAGSQKIFDSIMDNFAAEFRTKIRLNILPIWDKKYDTNLNTFNSFNTKLDDVHRIMFRTYLLNLFESYYSGFKSDAETLTNSINDKVAKMSVILAGLSLPLYGYDAKYTQDGKAQLYEIVPNAKKIKTPATDPKMFGYNPYDQYKKLNISGGEIINHSDVKTIFQNTSTGTWDGISTPSLIDYVGLGNGLYFFKQLVNEVSVGSTINSPIFSDTSAVINEYVRNMEFLQKVFGYDTIDDLPNQYNFKNYLPKSKVFSNAGPGSYNYYFETPFSFNPTEFGTSSSARDLETTGDNLVTRLADGSIANTANNSFGVGNYEMKYTWEKLNYEMLEFSNKTLDLMLSDELETKLNDVDFTYTPSLEFDMQLTGLTGTTAITPTTGATTGVTTGVTTGSTTDNTLASLLFYYGDNKKPNRLLNPVNYYLFNKDNPNITGTDLETILDTLNNLLKYDFTINEFFINALPDNNILALTGDTTDGKSVDLIKLSAMHELIFMEFMVKINADKNIHIEALKTQFLESIAVPANIKNKPKKVEKYIEQRTKAIESTIKDVFNLFGNFVSEFDSAVSDLFFYNLDVRNNTVKKINKNVFEGPENDYLNLTPEEIKNKLMKGGVEDYTLTMRETSKLDNTIVRNLKLFTKYKSDPIINISSALEAETETKNETTQLAQLYPEFYQ